MDTSENQGRRVAKNIVQVSGLRQCCSQQKGLNKSHPFSFTLTSQWTSISSTNVCPNSMGVWIMQSAQLGLLQHKWECEDKEHCTRKSHNHSFCYLVVLSFPLFKWRSSHTTWSNQNSSKLWQLSALPSYNCQGDKIGRRGQWNYLNNNCYKMCIATKI